MSELTAEFKSAIVSFTEANNFILMMPDLLGNYADDVQYQLFEKRKKLSAQEKELALSDFDEEYAVFAYTNLLPDGFLLILYTLLDECLFSIAQEVSRLTKIPLHYDRGKTGCFTADRAIQFLTDEVGIQIANLCPSWEKIRNFRRLRDIVASDHCYVRDEHVSFMQSLAQSSKHFSYKDVQKIFNFEYAFLNEICEMMVSFIHELEKPLSEFSEEQT